VIVADALVWASWFTAAATLALTCATAAVALAGFRALRQLRFAVEELEEVKKDRHVQVFADFGARWDGPAMSEALEHEAKYTRESLERLVVAAKSDPPSYAIVRRARQRRAEAALVVLLRVPNYFEDLSIVVQAGGLDLRLVGKNFKALAVDEWAFWSDALAIYRSDDPYVYAQFEWLARELEQVPDE
jgi:hypothetical protein